jgi:predicted RNA binding protein YcfA (HicA-like mRNA interferase family)
VPRQKRDIEAALTAKGFLLAAGDHRFYVYFTLAGKKTRARTKTSHTPKMKDVPDNLLSEMAKQCKLTKPQFLDLVDCPLSRQDYEAALAARGEL